MKLQLFLIICLSNVIADSFVPVISLEQKEKVKNTTTQEPLKFLPFIMLIDGEKDTSEYWRETEVLSLVMNNEADIDYDKCNQHSPEKTVVQFPSQRTVRPICRTNNERSVHPSEYRTYCEKKYGKWRTMFLPADPTECRCCDECIFYRELDQSCMQDEYNFEADEFLPVTTIDFRAGCNPYWGHPEQESRALRCDKILRRCVPISIPALPSETINVRRSYRFEPPTSDDCPLSCRGWECSGGQVAEERCPLGAFLPDRETCNCCGRCSSYQQLNQKCAEFKKTVHFINGSKETEVEEEFLEPGCDDGLVCRQGLCQDIHSVPTPPGLRRKRDESLMEANEPCKKELKYFKKKYGKDGHLHYNAPQCTPLWLYAPVQCRRFVCYCSLEDGTFIQGIKVPRVEVSNMNCDCVREKCRTGSNVECDGYGNYKEAIFSPHLELVHHVVYSTTTTKKNSVNFRTGYEAALPAKPIPF
ncbi:hypothetical protein KGM_200759 [Danaus plexippus plexippus]|uniref:Thyroglobulin type-1 domain-containing protein n=1 Tax=Danaus plexippus plexippus TaxID=278856 RepID=A0A212F7P7_DANPL|nr:hypothetical protein KGM_200759 [Danaus plexippus plexippus]